jgi:hypothetical protein
MNVFRCHVLLPRLKSEVHNILTKDEVLRINLNIGGVLITSTSHPPFLTLLNLSPFHLVPLLRYSLSPIHPVCEWSSDPLVFQLFTDTYIYVFPFTLTLSVLKQHKKNSHVSEDQRWIESQ